MKKTLLGISAAALMSLTAINVNASDNIDDNDDRLNTSYSFNIFSQPTTEHIIGIDNKGDQSSISHSFNIFYQPTTEHIITDENAKTPTQPSFQNEDKIDILSQLPDEVKLHVLGYLSVEDIVKVIRLNHSWHNMTNYSEIPQVIALQQSHPAIKLHMNDLKIDIIKAMLTGKTEVLIHPAYERGTVAYAINNNGELFTKDIDDCETPLHRGIALQGPTKIIYSNCANANRTVHAGTTKNGIDNISRPYVSTDLKTIKFFQIPDGVNDAWTKAVSADGTTIIGQAYMCDTSYGFIWTEESDMKLLLSPEKIIGSRAFGINSQNNMIGGSIHNSDECKAVIWINNGTRTLSIEGLLNPSHYYETSDVRGFSPNGRILWGLTGDSSYWSCTCIEDM